MFTRRYPLPLVLLGVPVRGKSNPYIAATTSVQVHVEVELWEEESTPRLDLSVEPTAAWQVRVALRSFLEAASERLEAPMGARVYARVEGVSIPPSGSLYAVLSLALVEAIAFEGGYSMEPREVVEAADSIDVDAGVDLDFLHALREAVRLGGWVAARRGEETLKLTAPKLKLLMVGEEQVAGTIEDRLGEEELTLIAKLIGSTVVKATRAAESSSEWAEALWPVAARIENAVYYLLFALQPPGEGCKWTPSLQAGYAVCRVDAGERGEEVQVG